MAKVNPTEKSAKKSTKYAVAFAQDDMHSSMMAGILNDRLYDSVKDARKAIKGAIASDHDMYFPDVEIGEESEDDGEFDLVEDNSTNTYSWVLNGGDAKGYYEIKKIKV